MAVWYFADISFRLPSSTSSGKPQDERQHGTLLRLLVISPDKAKITN
jgi:hypothetical protein